MKKMFFVLVAATLTIGVYAQDSKEKKWNKDVQSGNMARQMKDCVMMKDGKMMVMKGGETTQLDNEITLSNGSKVGSDGKVTTKDGKTMMMKEGQSMTMDGKMGKMKMHEGMKKDETKM